MALTPPPTANCLQDDWIITFEAMPYIMIYITDGSVFSYPNPLGLPVYILTLINLFLWRFSLVSSTYLIISSYLKDIDIP